MANSLLPGDINQAKKRTSLSDLTSMPAAYSQPGPVKLAPQQPARKPYPNPGGSVHTSELGGGLGMLQTAAKLAPAAIGLIAGHQLDTGRNALINAAGGDPKTASGGADKYTKAGTHAGMAHGYMMDRNGGSIDPGGLVLAATGASPVQAAERPQSLTAPTPAKPAQPSAGNAQPVQGGAAAPATNPLTEAPYQRTSVPGAVSRRGADGVMEFTDRPDAVAGAQGEPAQSAGGLSVVSGGRQGMARNLLATEIMQQTRREQANPNYVTTVRDSGAAGVQGLLNGLANEKNGKDGKENTKQQGQRIAEGAARITGLEGQLQQVAQADRAAEADQRVKDLQARIADPRLPPEERALAERSYQALTVSGKDRYMLQDVIMGQDAMGSPIIGRVALDTLTGQQVGAGAGQGAAAPRTVTLAEVQAKAKQDGVSPAEVIEAARQQGIEVRN